MAHTYTITVDNFSSAGDGNVPIYQILPFKSVNPGSSAVQEAWRRLGKDVNAGSQQVTFSWDAPITAPKINWGEASENAPKVTDQTVLIWKDGVFQQVQGSVKLELSGFAPADGKSGAK